MTTKTLLKVGVGVAILLNIAAVVCALVGITDTSVIYATLAIAALYLVAATPKLRIKAGKDGLEAGSVDSNP